MRERLWNILSTLAGIVWDYVLFLKIQYRTRQISNLQRKLRSAELARSRAMDELEKYA